MRVLVACEFSGVVRDAFAAHGHDAWSCDLLPSETPGQHIQGDVLGILGDGWDLMVAHPPCTYLSRAGARWLHAGGRIDGERYRLGLEAVDFFMQLLHAHVPRVAVENPTPLRECGLPPHNQAIQPYEFGHPYSKRTLLWLRNLPPLMPTDIVVRKGTWVPSNKGGARRGTKVDKGVALDARIASRTFPGIAAAMADQWGAINMEDK